MFDRFFGVGTTSVRPNILSLMVRIIVTEVILTGAMLFDQECSCNHVNPAHGVLADDFEIIYMSGHSPHKGASKHLGQNEMVGSPPILGSR